MTPFNVMTMKKSIHYHMFPILDYALYALRQLTDDKHITKDDEGRTKYHNAVPVIVFSVMSMEAFINEVLYAGVELEAMIADGKGIWKSGNNMATNSLEIFGREASNLAQVSNIKKKYKCVRRHISDTPKEKRGSRYYADIDLCAQMRNALAHPWPVEITHTDDGISSCSNDVLVSLRRKLQARGLISNKIADNDLAGR